VVVDVVVVVVLDLDLDPVEVEVEVHGDRYFTRLSTASQATFLKNASTYFARSVAR
jgi:hypothetical protein